MVKLRWKGSAKPGRPSSVYRREYERRINRVMNADLPDGKYAVARFEGRSLEISQAWEILWTAWLPGSGYQPEERPCLELRQSFETSSAKGHVRCELCLPIGPL